MDDRSAAPTVVEVARFWSQVDVAGPGECWPWRSALNGSGYGAVKWRGAGTSASRVAYRITHPEVVLESTDFVCHHCDNPMCCNPGHLFLGDAASNMADMHAKGRGRPPGAAARAKGAVTKHRRAVDERLPALLAQVRERQLAGLPTTYRSIAKLDGYWSARNTLGMSHRQIVEAARCSA